MSNKKYSRVHGVVCGVGYRNNTPTTEDNGSRKPYSIWKNMIYRCYSKTSTSYMFYGGNGVVVSDEWLCYDTFRKEMEHLEGFSLEAFYEDRIELDKDGLDKESKTYSKGTCRWVTRSENLSLIVREYPTPTKFKVDRDGTTVVLDSATEVAKYVGCSKSYVYISTRNEKEFMFKGYLIKRETINI